MLFASLPKRENLFNFWLLPIRRLWFHLFPNSRQTSWKKWQKCYVDQLTLRRSQSKTYKFKLKSIGHSCQTITRTLAANSVWSQPCYYFISFSVRYLSAHACVCVRVCMCVVFLYPRWLRFFHSLFRFYQWVGNAFVWFLFRLPFFDSLSLSFSPWPLMPVNSLLFHSTFFFICKISRFISCRFSHCSRRRRRRCFFSCYFCRLLDNILNMQQNAFQLHLLVHRQRLF